MAFKRSGQTSTKKAKKLRVGVARSFRISAAGIETNFSTESLRSPRIISNMNKDGINQAQYSLQTVEPEALDEVEELTFRGTARSTHVEGRGIKPMRSSRRTGNYYNQLE